MFGENQRSQTTSGQGWWKRSGSSHQIVLTAVTSVWEPRGAKEERGPEGGGLQPAKKPLSWRGVGNSPCFAREGRALSISPRLQPLSRAATTTLTDLHTSAVLPPALQQTWYKYARVKEASSAGDGAVPALHSLPELRGWGQARGRGRFVRAHTTRTGHCCSQGSAQSGDVSSVQPGLTSATAATPPCICLSE